MRLGSSKGSNRLPEGWIEGKDICTQSGLIRYLGIFLEAPEKIAKHGNKELVIESKKGNNVVRKEKIMPATRAGRGTALKNSILAQAWFFVENQTPSNIEAMMEDWRKEAWSFYANHANRCQYSRRIFISAPTSSGLTHPRSPTGVLPPPDLNLAPSLLLRLLHL